MKRPCSRVVLVVLACLDVALLSACTMTPSPPAAVDSSATARAEPASGKRDLVITMTHYLEIGRQAVRVYLEEQAAQGREDLAQVESRCRDVCVRVSVSPSLDAPGIDAGAKPRGNPDAPAGMGFNAVAGSGVLVAGGKFVLTAGHVLEGLAAEDPIRVTTASGTTFPARIFQRELDPMGGLDKDWALLRIDAAVPLPAARIGRGRVKEHAFVLGYPQMRGINAEGRIVQDPGLVAVALAPLMVVARVQQSAPQTLVPVAGCASLEGASGGGIFNEKGELMGILTGGSETFGPDPDAADQFLGVCVADLKERLGDRIPWE